ncbi:MAG: hypothetical protein LUH51_00880 [Firmicutes bacterium]|nr:hypothetical protein [Bacillota bacterium]
MDNDQEKQDESFSLEDIMREFGAQLPPEAEIPEPTVPEEPAEPAPFEEGWEPEFEQPIAEYVQPEPIVFRPKSRLRELKRQLIAGPEKRYYDLTEMGFAKLQLAIFASLLVVLASSAITILNATGAIGSGRIRFVIFAQFLCLLLSATLGSYQLLHGLGDMFKGRFSLNSLLSFSLAACVADGIFCLRELRVPCCVAFCLNVTMSLWSEYEKRSAEVGQMDTMRKAVRLDSVVAVPDYLDGRPGYLRGEGQVEDFMDTYAVPSTPEKVMNIYALAALGASLAIGVVALLLGGVSACLQTFSAALLVGVPASSFIALSRPAAILEKRMHAHGTVFCGWKGICVLSSRGAFPLDDTDLFPIGSVKLNGVKFYGHRDPDQVVAYAAALVDAGGGALMPLLDQLAQSRGCPKCEVTEFRTYNGGIGAVVDNEAVLAGTITFLQSMGVDLPKGTKVNQAAYVAVDGELCGVFAVSYGKSKDIHNAITTLCAYRGLTPVLLARDFMLTEAFLRYRFGINPKRIAFPGDQQRAELAARSAPEGAPALALTTFDNIAGAAYAVTGARSLRSASRVGVAVNMLGGILGLVMMLVLTLVHAEYLLTPTNILLYELVWMLPGLLITEWTRSV